MALVCGRGVRLTIADNALSVVYVPYSDWLGADTLTYTVFIGPDYSTPATVTLHTRKCRLNCVNDVYDALPLYPNGA